MKWLGLVILLAGIALAGWLVLHFGAPAIGEALSAAGWRGLFAISAFHLLMIALMGVAWWMLDRGARPWIFLWGRLMRDSGSEVLPLSQVGGYVLGARAVVIHGVSRAVAAASTVVDVTLELCAQIVYTALGLGLVLWLRPHSNLAVPVVIGLAGAVAVVPAFVAAQRRGSSLLARLTARIARGWVGAVVTGATTVEAEIRRIHGARGALWISMLLHLAAWIGTGFEAWIVLRLMGVRLGIGPVLAIESLLYAIRSVAFAVPNAIGVQEGAYVMLGAVFGLPPNFALGLSLLKRGRDLTLGIPALLIWQLVESRKYLRLRDPALATDEG